MCQVIAAVVDEGTERQARNLAGLRPSGEEPASRGRPGVPKGSTVGGCSRLVSCRSGNVGARRLG